MKTCMNSSEAKNISVCDPSYYQQRFKKFICDKVLSSTNDKLQMQDKNEFIFALIS